MQFDPNNPADVEEMKKALAKLGFTLKPAKSEPEGLYLVRYNDPQRGPRFSVRKSLNSGKGNSSLPPDAQVLDLSDVKPEDWHNLTKYRVHKASEREAAKKGLNGEEKLPGAKFEPA